MKKQLQLFLVHADEVQLSECLRAEVPGVLFLNDNVWASSPDYRSGVEDCQTGRVYLYTGRPEDLPVLRRKNGDIEGPIAGCVVQILRPIEQEGVLLSGRVAAGINDDDEQMRDIVDRVWKCIRSIGKIGVVRPDGKTDRNYLIGHNARRLQGDGRLKLVDRAIGMKYEPAA